MPDATKKWRCDFCKSENPIKLKNELQICGTCGLGYPTRTMTQSANDGSLSCLPVTNLARKTPSGSMGEMWVDGAGQKFSRHDYINAYKIDPKIFLEYQRSKRDNAQMRF
jgi:hypothetical protein